MTYKVIWDNGNCIDSTHTEYHTVREAIEIAKEILHNWIFAEMERWTWNQETCFPEPTLEQIDDWDYMIANCYVYIVEKDGNYSEELELSDNDYKEVGWMEWNEYIKEMNKRKEN